jgi:tRNA threonylcarbamoyladenosine biosynthesis protein TsaB
LKLLALDTATEACSAAILVDSQIIQKYCIAPRRHAELIITMIDELLAEAGTTLADLDALAFGRGPGAFTGIRIAAGVAQGLAYGADLPVIPVSTLAALALGSEHKSQYILSAIDARMAEIYWAVFEPDTDGLVTPVTEEYVSKPEDIQISINGTYRGAGTGWRNYHETLASKLGDQLLGASAEAFPQARDVLALAIRELKRGNTVTPEAALPVYLRNKVTG